jgi:PHP family Zn ribbon phosphoesterase
MLAAETGGVHACRSLFYVFMAVALLVPAVGLFLLTPRCPRCRRRMRHVPWEQPFLFQCPPCGHRVDSGFKPASPD